MVKVDNCCCCFSVKTGTNIIGILFIIDLIGEFWHPTINPLRWTLKIIVATVFMMMYLKDTQSSRMLFFFIFIANIFLKPVVNYATDDSDDPEGEEAWKNMSLDKIAKDTCDKMSAQDRKNMHFDTME